VLRQHIGDGGNELIVRTEGTGGRGGPRQQRTVYERKPGITG
jgi:hypothetical protein